LNPFTDLLRILPDWDFSGSTLFDAGAGYGEFGFYLKALSGTQRVKYRGVPRIVGCDLNPERVRNSRLGVYDEFYEWNLCDTPYTFLKEKPRFTVCLETLEHLPNKAESLRVLEYLESLSPNMVVSVPLGDHRTQYHHSIWDTSDFSKRGYDVSLLDMTGLTGKSRRLYNFYRRVRGRPAEYIVAIKRSG